MKWFFVLLLLVNVAYLGWEIDRSSKQYRANKQTAINIPANVNRLQLVAELDTPPEARQVPVVPDEGYQQVNMTSMLPIEMNPNTENMIQALLNESSMIQLESQFLQEDSADTGIDTEPANTICYTYGPIPEKKESTLMSEWLNERGIEYEQRQTTEDGLPKFWVYLAPQASTARAEQAVEELKQQGIRDLQLIRSGDLLNAVSLGLFSSQAAVNRRLNEIKATGYQPVVVPYAGGKQVYWFDVMLVQNSSYVNELFTGFPARFKALPVNCDEIAKR
ncbi:MAG: SPOR domain-containing protein [Gammaproteobacteria bacterium]